MLIDLNELLNLNNLLLTYHFIESLSIIFFVSFRNYEFYFKFWMISNLTFFEEMELFWLSYFYVYFR